MNRGRHSARTTACFVLAAAWLAAGAAGAGTITGVVPAEGPFAGGDTVTIYGTGLGNGTDITNATLCSAAAGIVSQTSTNVVVWAGAAISCRTGSVAVMSGSLGLTLKTNAYRYHAPGHIHGVLDGWTAAPALPVPLTRHAAVEAGGKLYVVGGKTLDGMSPVVTTNAYVFDPANPGDGWQVAGAIVAPRMELAAAVLDGKIYTMGGSDGTASRRAVYVYDTADPGLGWQLFNKLPEPRSLLGGCSANGKLYAIGGYDAGKKDTLYVCDPSTTNGWYLSTDLWTEYSEAAAAAIDGWVYRIGGRYDAGGEWVCMYVEGHDTKNPGADWEGFAALNGPRTLLGAAVIEGRLYAVAGKDDNDNDTKGVYEYDSTVFPFRERALSDLPYELCGCAAVSVGYSLYVIGGETGGVPVSAVWYGTNGPALSPSTGVFSGGTELTIRGTNLGDGSDVTNVTLGAAAAAILSQSATQLVVRSAEPQTWGTVDVAVRSTTRGETREAAGFTYMDPGFIRGEFESWTSISNLPAAREAPALVNADGTLYAIGGKNAAGTAQDTVYTLDLSSPETGWTQATNLPAARVNLAGAWCAGKVYAIGGTDGAAKQATVFAYDPAQPGDGWTSVSNLPVAMVGLAVATVDDAIYITGGLADAGARATAYVYDPATPQLGWQSISNLPSTLYGHAATTVKGRLYTLGGMTPGGRTTAIHEYDTCHPDRGWQQVADLPAARRRLGAASVGGRIYALGGEAPSGAAVDTVYEFDPVRPALGSRAVQSLPENRESLATAQAGDRIYAVGGYAGSAKAEAYVATIGSGVSPAAGPFAGSNLVTITGVDLGNGTDITNVTLCGTTAEIVEQSVTQVVVRAGIPDVAELGAVVVYSSSRGLTRKQDSYTYCYPGFIHGDLEGWETMPALPEKITQLAAAELDGKIYAIAGSTPDGASSNVYVFDIASPEAGWTTNAALPVRRKGLAAAAAGGKIYAMGGRLTTNDYDAAFVYDPAHPETGWTPISNMTYKAGYLAACGALGCVYVCGGGAWDDYWWTISKWNSCRYDPAHPEQGWVANPDMPMAKDSHALVTVPGFPYIYAVAGRATSGATRKVYRLDARNTGAGWKKLTDFPADRIGLAGASVHGKAYVMASRSVTHRVHRLDPTAPDSTWTHIGELPAALVCHAVVEAGGDLYIVGGENLSGNRSDQVYRSVFGSGVTPGTGPLWGSNLVTIVGTHLGSGTDIQSVTLCGIPVTRIVSQSATQVVVEAGASPGVMLGDVVVTSAGHGTAIARDAYRYDNPVVAVLGASGTRMAEGQPASVPLATDFEGLPLSMSWTNTLTVSNASVVALVMDGVNLLGAGAADFEVCGMPAGLLPFESVDFQVAFQPSATGMRTAVVEVVCQATNSPFHFSVSGRGCVMAPSCGAQAGGHTLTIVGAALGDGYAVTNVTVCGAEAAILSQSATQVVVQVGASGGWGLGDIVLGNAAGGTVRIHEAYTVNPPGYILGDFVGWTSISNLPSPRSALAAAAVDGKVYAIGGWYWPDYPHSGPARDEVLVYDPQMPEAGWTAVTNLPDSRAWLGAAVAQGDIYVVGGGNRTVGDSDLVWRYDPDVPGAGWTAVSSLPDELERMGVAACLGKLYSLGGHTPGTSTDAVHCYDPAHPEQGWVSVPDLPQPSDSVQAASVAGRLYAVGGLSFGAKVYEYAPTAANPAWGRITDMPVPLVEGGAATVGGRLCYVTGKSNEVSPEAYYCDPSAPTATWTRMPDLPGGRRWPGVTALGDRIYVIGGHDDSNVDYSTVFEGTFASGVAPASGSVWGGNTVTISGINLCDGEDVTNVFLCGASVAQIVSQSRTQVVVVAGAAVAGPVTGAVEVCSLTYGTTVKPAAYTYEQGYVITAQAGPHGSMVPCGLVCVDAGADTNFVVSADPYWTIAELLTNGVADPAATNRAVYTSLWQNVGADADITASFTANLAEFGTPHWWLALYGLTNNGATFDEAETNDVDGDAFSAHDERIADTDPTNANSYFCITGISNNSPIQIWFDSSSNRLYALYCTSNLTEEVWTNTPCQGPRPGAGGPDHMTDTNPAPQRFFRLGVTYTP